jgi:hypothetical protein
MKEQFENIVMILEDVKATYSQDRFIKERLSTAIKRTKELGRVEPQVIKKIAESLDNKIKDYEKDKSNFPQPYKEGGLVALKEFKKENASNFSL